MDAREYMAKKGIGGGRDEQRPNTLEEKAWARAREAGDHRPRAGTPHDWEDWERHHDELAEGAEQIEQKIDHEAHRDLEQGGARVSPGVRAEASMGRGAVPAHPTIRLALKALAVLLPPLAVGLSGGGSRRLMVSVVLTLLGWLPGVVHALHWLRPVCKTTRS